MAKPMLKPISVAFAVAVATVALPPRNARAVALIFSSPGPGDVPGVVRVDMWFEDPSREVLVSAVQFDADIAGGSPAGGILLPNTSRSDGAYPPPYEGPEGFPFGVRQTITDPTGPVDVRVIDGSSDLLYIDLLASVVAAYPHCTGAACPLQEVGLEHDRLYLGSFDLVYAAQPVFLRINPNTLFGEGDPYDYRLVFELRDAVTGPPYCDDPRGCRIEGLAPEPSGLGLVGAALAALRVVHRQTRNRRGSRPKRRARPRGLRC